MIAVPGRPLVSRYDQSRALRIRHMQWILRKKGCGALFQIYLLFILSKLFKLHATVLTITKRVECPSKVSDILGQLPNLSGD